MPRWPSTVIIAGVDFSGCRTELLDGEDFLTPFRGSVDWGKSGVPLEQQVNVGVKGVSFGIRFLSTELNKFEDMNDAINAAKATRQPFRVQIQDELYSIDVWAIKDTNQKETTHGLVAEGYVQNAVLRLISKAQYA